MRSVTFDAYIHATSAIDVYVILVRIKFIEFDRYLNAAVLPVICARTDVPTSAIKHRDPKQDEF